MERLTDIERKMLNILRNYNTLHHGIPPMRLLRAKTGRNEEGVMKVLDGLAKKGYIQWDRSMPLFKIVIVVPFEPNWGNWWSKYV